MIKDFPVGTETRIKNLLDVDALTTGDIEMILDNSTAMLDVLSRDIKKVPILRGKTIITLFYESSTRTRVSFEQAGKILSADVINISANTSSTKKGESLQLPFNQTGNKFNLVSTLSIICLTL